jgi:hypothetical protein
VSERARRDHELCGLITTAHQRSRRTYGAPRIRADLAAAGVRVGKKRVARLMRQLGVAGVSRRGARRTTISDQAATPAPDHVQRRFTATRPNQRERIGLQRGLSAGGWLGGWVDRPADARCCCWVYVYAARLSHPTSRRRIGLREPADIDSPLPRRLPPCESLLPVFEGVAEFGCDAKCSASRVSPSALMESACSWFMSAVTASACASGGRPGEFEQARGGGARRGDHDELFIVVGSLLATGERAEDAGVDECRVGQVDDDAGAGREDVL